MLLWPTPKPRTYERPSLLPRLWLDGINGSFAEVVRKRPHDATIAEMQDVLVVDYPPYVKGLLDRLRDSEDEPNLLDELSHRHSYLGDCYSEHPLEVDVEADDINQIGHVFLHSRWGEDSYH
jgi:hypothetical protein